MKEGLVSSENKILNNSTKQKSAYRLFVKFSDENQAHPKDFNYFSDNRIGNDKGLDFLLKRVLEGACKNRYDIAMLYETATNTCIRVYLPSNEEMSYEDYIINYKNTPPSSTLKAFIVCKENYIEQLKQKSQVHPIILQSMDNHLSDNLTRRDVALFYFRQQLLGTELAGNYLFANIYDQIRNIKVAQFDDKAQLIYMEDIFLKDILSYSDYEVEDLGIIQNEIGI